MSDPGGLEERLRAALAQERLHGARGPGGTGSDAARAQVLAGIRRRRLRRLQVLGACAVVALGLALGLPQVLGPGTSPSASSTQATGQANGSQAKGSPATFGPAVHRPAARGRSASPAAALPRKAVGICDLQRRTVSDCGVLETGSAAQTLGADAARAQRREAFGSSQSAKRFGSPLEVRAGTRVVIDLPPAGQQWRWATPSIAGTPVYHGRYRAPVTVSATRSQGGTQKFVVATKAPVTVLLEAKDDVLTGAVGTPGPEPLPAVWVLELKVEGT